MAWQVGQAPDPMIEDIVRRSLAIWPALMLAFGPFYALIELVSAAQDLMAGQPSHTGVQPFGWLFVLGIVLAVTVGGVASGALTRGALDLLDGGELQFGNAIDTGIQMLAPILALGFVAAVQIALGFVLLIVPGLILAAGYFVAVAVSVAERLGPWASLRRSRALAQGFRWQILGLILLIALAEGGSAVVRYGVGAWLGAAAGAIAQVVTATALEVWTGALIVTTYRALAAGSAGRLAYAKQP
jgi:hypothetical protein